MIGSLRLRLTAFFTAVTGVILLAVTVLCLFLSEQSIRARTIEQFDRDMQTITSYVSSQQFVSGDWLRQVETAGNLAISIFDEGMPLYAMRHSQEVFSQGFAQVRQRAQEELGGKGGSFALDLDGSAFLGGYSLISGKNSNVELILLHPLGDMERGIVRQRLVVCLAEGLALVLLWGFCWYFTGKLLRPIEESQQRQAQFTAAASHELRTPLAAILSAASAMEGAEETNQRHFLGQIQSQGQRMSRLIGDMLVLSSADTGSWKMQTAVTEPDMLLLEAYESYLPMAKQAERNLTIALPEDVPAVSLDQERMHQVLTILLDNALSYTPPGGEILLSLHRSKCGVRFLVSDSGPGVPAGERERIFERFHRSEAARSDRSHFGLGLSIAAQIVKLHGGKIWVQDAALGGAEFVVELPL